MTVLFATLASVLLLSLMVGSTSAGAGGLSHSSARPIERVSVAVSGVLLACVAALRWGVGTDYENYAVGFPNYVAESLSLSGEPGFKLLARAARLISDDYASMFALASVMTIGLCIWTIYRYSWAPQLAVVLFVVVGAWHGSFNGVRQYIACAVIFAGHRLVINRQFVLYATVVAIAALFHISALLMILLYFVPRRQLSVLGSAGLFGVTVVLASLDQIDIAAEAIRGQDISGSTYFLESVNPARIAFAFAPFLLYALFTDKALIRAQDFFYVNIAVVNAAIWLASSQSAYLARLAIYTNVFVVLLIPILLNHRDASVRAGLTLIVIIAFSVYWYFDIWSQESLREFHWIFER